MRNLHKEKYHFSINNTIVYFASIETVVKFMNKELSIVRIFYTRSFETGDGVNEEDWFVDTELSSMAELLQTILYQTVQSMADASWELRRMGQQVGIYVLHKIKFISRII